MRRSARPASAGCAASWTSGTTSPGQPGGRRSLARRARRGVQQAGDAADDGSGSPPISEACRSHARSSTSCRCTMASTSCGLCTVRATSTGPGRRTAGVAGDRASTFSSGPCAGRPEKQGGSGTLRPLSVRARPPGQSSRSPPIASERAPALRNAVNGWNGCIQCHEPTLAEPEPNKKRERNSPSAVRPTSMGDPPIHVLSSCSWQGQEVT